MNQVQKPLFITCTTHRTCPYSFISIAKEITQKRLQCAECIIPESQSNTNLIEMIPLSIAVNPPESLLNSVKQDFCSSFLKQLNNFIEMDLQIIFKEQIKICDQIIQKLHTFKQKLTEQQERYQQLQEQFKQLKQQFLEIYLCFTLDEFRDKVFALQKSGESQFCSDQYLQQEKELTNILNRMLKDNCALINQNFTLIQQKHNNLTYKLEGPELKQLLDQTTLLDKYEQSILQLNQNAQKSFSKLLTGCFCQIINNKIQKDTKLEIIQKRLIFLGSCDGLNGNAFWSKVNGKKNLLMIFKSKNDGKYVFGVYSPCLWEKNAQEINVQDDSITSFIFSQSYNQIYPLKKEQKQNAINCNSGYGPLIGIGHDIRIDLDFNNGYSKLGASYQWDQYKGENSNYLFGGATPNIEECEIFEIIFR